MTCTYYGRCAKCTVPPDQLGEPHAFSPRIQSHLLDAYGLADSDVRAFHLACRDAGMKPIYRPFWETLPLAWHDIFLSVTPEHPSSDAPRHGQAHNLMDNRHFWCCGD